jgi:mRNA interferase HigB
MGSLSVSAHKQKVKQSAIFMALNIVSRTRLEEFWAIHAKAKVPLTNWYNTTLKATWTCFSDVKKTYRSADLVNEFIVFDVSSFRIIGSMVYVITSDGKQTKGRVFIKHVFTHSDYDNWSKGQR